MICKGGECVSDGGSEVQPTCSVPKCDPECKGTEECTEGSCVTPVATAWWSAETAIFDYHFSNRKTWAQAKEYCQSYGEGWDVPKPGCVQENNEIVFRSNAKYTKTAQEIWIDVNHNGNEWDYENGFCHWASHDKAADPDTNGDQAIIRTGTKA